jgi:hypothetical protein
VANGTDVTALGAGANATGINATALGAGATTTRNNQVVIGTRGTQVTISNLAGAGTELVAASADGTLVRSTGISFNNGSLSITNDLTVGGNTYLNGDLQVAGASYFNGPVSMNNSLTVNGPTTINNSLTVNGNQTINGNSVISGNQLIGGSLSVSGPASFSGGATVSNGLAVTGGTTTDNLQVNGNTTLDGPVKFSGLVRDGKFLGDKYQRDGESRIMTVDRDGNAGTSPFTTQQVNEALTETIPKLESAARGLGQAVESSGAIAAAMSAIPEVSLQDDEPMRCGVGTGGYGSQYAVSAGCAVRISDRLHINGAVAYTPSIDYQYGSTPSVAGRLGFSFPLGRIAKRSSKPSAESLDELSKVQGSLEQLQKDIDSRDQQIAELRKQLDKLLSQSPLHDQSPANMATVELVAMLKQRIDQLESEKRQSEAENTRQDKKIQQLEARLAEQESMFQRAMNQLKSMMSGKVVEHGPTSLANP